MSEDFKNNTYKYDTEETEKIFLVFNTLGFGDILLCNSLCQNIKHIFPNSKVVFVSDSAFQDAARYQECVDDVVVYDWYGKHQGDDGFKKFVNDCKYKNVFASVITCYDEKQYEIAKLLNSKHISVERERIFISVQERHNFLLNQLTDEALINYPIRINLPKLANNYAEEMISTEEKYVTLCCLSNSDSKNMPLETTVDLIHLLEQNNFKTVIVGTKNDLTDTYINLLERKGLSFINMMGKTNIPKLGQVICNSKFLISVDTGTMHYGYALKKPTVCIFYEEGTSKLWAPDKNLYNYTSVLQSPSAESIIKEAMTLYKQYD